MEQEFFIGEHALYNFDKLLDNANAKTVFLVRGHKSFDTCGAHTLLDGIFKRHKLNVVEFKDFSANPYMSEVDNGVGVFKSSDARLIVAVGGGSAIDTAKLIRTKIGDATIKIIAIPTTAGTGAECTHCAIAIVDGLKQSFDGPLVGPDYAVVYPPFTYNNPEYLTACTGFDAVGQAIESYWNLNADDESDKFSMDALRLMWNILPNAVNPGFNKQERIYMSEGSYYSGRAINITRTTAPHAFSYILTSKYGYAHGHAVALTFPFFFDFNINCPRDEYVGKDYDKFKLKMKRMQDYLGIGDRTGMLKYIHHIGLDKIDVLKIDWDYYFSNINLGRLGNNPRRITKETMQSLKDYLENSVCKDMLL